MSMRQFLPIANARPFALAAVPQLPPAEFREAVRALVDAEARLAALHCWDFPEGRRLLAVVADGAMQHLLATSAPVGESYPSLTPAIPSAHLFEREIFEEQGVRPEGHPWLKPLRGPVPGRAPGDIDFLRVEGASLHEVGVGPVHAGVIEPGHFRFSCDGEKVIHLEIALGYQHRGWSRRFLAAPPAVREKLVEVIAGDTTIAHALCHARALEAAHRARVSPAADFWRCVALELERLANHVGDLGALSGDAGFLPSASFCGRLRGDILNATAVLCGNRFGRGLVVPGGLGRMPGDDAAAELARRLQKSERECAGAVELLLDAPSVLARFEDVGTVTAAQARDLGLVGVAARAAGLEMDTRYDFPLSDLYAEGDFRPDVEKGGDVAARARVRWAECRRSFALLQEWLERPPAPDPFPAVDLAADGRPVMPNSGVVVLEEGWRGEVCHVALFGTAGEIAGYRVVDPSFHNWFGLAMALRGEEISNFPLCNKSFNLSYCGTDL